MTARFPPSSRDPVRLPPPSSLFRLPSPREARARNLPSLVYGLDEQSSRSLAHPDPDSRYGQEAWTRPTSSHYSTDGRRTLNAHAKFSEGHLMQPPAQPDNLASSSMMQIDRNGVKRPRPDNSEAAYGHLPSSYRSMIKASKSPTLSADFHPGGDHAAHDAHRLHSRTESIQSDRSSECLHYSPAYSQMLRSPSMARGLALQQGPPPQQQQQHPAYLQSPWGTFAAYRASSSPPRIRATPPDGAHRGHRRGFEAAVDRTLADFDVDAPSHPFGRVQAHPIGSHRPLTVAQAPEARCSSSMHISAPASAPPASHHIVAPSILAPSPFDPRAGHPSSIQPQQPHPQHLLLQQQQQQQQQRKRLRISRACDECRRRKTRCDVVGAFPGEAGHPSTIAGLVPPIEPHQEPKGDMMILQPCMNCRRSGIACSYSKRPLKRGPSKGYIKDLERRLNSLESQMVVPDPAPAAAAAVSPISAKSPDSAAPTLAKPKVRTEDRIVRLERALNTSDKAGEASLAHCSDPLVTVKTDSSEQDPCGPAPSSSTISNDSPNIDNAPSAASTPPQPLRSDVFVRYDKASRGHPAIATVAAAIAAGNDANSPLAASQPRDEHRRDVASSPARSARNVKSAVLQSTLHATFPVVCYADRSDALVGLEGKVLSRGYKVLTDALDPTAGSGSAESIQTDTRESTPAPAKPKSHAARLAQIIGQASVGLGSACGDPFSVRKGRLDIERLKSMRKLAAGLAAQEADLLMLCQLDLLRRGQPNKSALAAAVTKLDTGAGDASVLLRRRIVMFMMDRWHSAGFGTPHVLTGRHALERMSFQSMKDAIADVERSPLASGSYEVLRASVMMGHLHDMAQSAGGWKHISPSDVDSIVHSVSEEHEPPTPEGSRLDPTSDAAFRYSLENAVRAYHAIHTLPPAGQAKLDDVGRLFEMAERIICLGKVKTPLTPASKLFLSAVGPQVASIVAVTFFWCCKVIAILTAQAYGDGVTDAESSSPSSSSSTSPTSSSAMAGAATASTARDGLVSASLQPLEHYRRKMQDYVRMVGMLSMFSGGAPSQPGAFKSLYLRVSLFHNQTLGFANKLGCLLQPPAADSPVRDGTRVLENEANGLIEMANEMGCLGYVLASTNANEAWSLLAGLNQTTPAAAD